MTLLEDMYWCEFHIVRSHRNILYQGALADNKKSVGYLGISGIQVVPSNSIANSKETLSKDANVLSSVAKSALIRIFFFGNRHFMQSITAFILT